MSTPMTNKYDGPDLPPSTCQKSLHDSNGTSKDTPYPKQENVTGAYPQVIPDLMSMPMPLRDVGQGNILYVVNQTGQSEGVDNNLSFGSSFGNKAIRAAFVRKVYAILMLQLLTTIGFIALFTFHEGIRQFVAHNFFNLMAAYVTFLVTYIILACCSSIRRTWPCNLIMLSIFTLSMSYWAATISTFYSTYTVIMTVGVVTVVCLGISLFSIQTKWDITGAGIYLFVIMLVVILFGIIATVVAITTGSRIMQVIYAGLLTMVFALHLVYDTQQIIGGRKLELSPEEHIYGALQLYIDIIFMYVMVLFLGGNSCK